MVQSWFVDPLHNYGVIIADDLNDDRVVFATREHATPDYRPRLYVDYTVGGGGAGGSGAAGSPGGRGP